MGDDHARCEHSQCPSKPDANLTASGSTSPLGILSASICAKDNWLRSERLLEALAHHGMMQWTRIARNG